jgi:hypothetical protein
VRSLHHGFLARFLCLLALLCGFWIALAPDVTAQGGITITSPAANALLRAGPDFASDIIGDAWDFSNAEDINPDPAQRRGWSSFGIANGRIGGILGFVDGAPNGSHISFLERAYWGGLKPGRSGAKFPIDAGSYTKLSFKMGIGSSGQYPRVYWFARDLGHPAGTGGGFRYTDPGAAAPLGDSISVVNLTQSLGGGDPWSGLVRGFALYPNSSTQGYSATFDWVRLTTGDGHPAAAMMPIAWSGGSGTATIQVIDAGGTVVTVASGVSGSSFSWNYGVLPPGQYTLRVTRGTSVGNSTFRVNAPPTIQITDPDETGGEDFASAVLGNPWDMNDVADIGTVAQDHLISRSFSGGQFHGVSDGVPVATSQDGIPVGDPIVYPLTNNGVVNTSRYRYLTLRMQVDGNYDLLRGSVGRIFWGSQAGSPYNVTVSSFFLVWPGMQTYTVDLGSLTTDPDGGIEPLEGARVPWSSANVRYLRFDPHEFAEQRGFHIDDVKLAAMDEPTNGTFTIRFTGSDADGHPSTVALYYDTDRNPSSGLTPIAASVPLANGQHAWNASGVPPGVYYVYAVVSDGLNARGAYSTGPVQISAAPSNLLAFIDTPANGSTVSQPFQVGGWAIDRGAPAGTGVDSVHVYAFPNPGSGAAGIFLGSTYGQPRPDVGAAFGGQFTNSGYNATANSLRAGTYLIGVYAHSTVSGSTLLRTATINVTGGPVMSLDQPGAGAVLQQPFALGGWAIDGAAASGTGVDAVQVWAYPNPGSGAAPVFVGTAQYGGSRPDVGAAYGSRFTNSGFNLSVRGLAPNVYQFVAFARSTATGTFNQNRTVGVTVQTTTAMALDTPVSGSRAQPFTVAGWAIDLASTSGTGVNSVHVWAYPNPGSGQPPIFLGIATYGIQRLDVGGIFGARFAPSGYSLGVNSLPRGTTYDIVVYARSTVSNAFDTWRVVRVTVP